VAAHEKRGREKKIRICLFPAIIADTHRRSQWNFLCILCQWRLPHLHAVSEIQTSQKCMWNWHGKDYKLT